MVLRCSSSCLTILTFVLVVNKLACAQSTADPEFLWRSSDNERSYWAYSFSPEAQSPSTVCEKDGGTVLVVNTDEVTTRDTFAAILWQTYWVGLRASDKGFAWVSSNATYQPWGFAEPKDGTENCAALSAGDRLPGRVTTKSDTAVYVQSADCNTVRPFICTLSPGLTLQRPSWITSTLTLPNGSGSYLAVAANTWANFDQALTLCKEANGTLAVLDSATTTNALADHLAATMLYIITPSGSVPSTRQSANVHSDLGSLVNGGVPGLAPSAAPSGTDGAIANTADGSLSCVMWSRLKDVFLNTTCPKKAQVLCSSEMLSTSPSTTLLGSKELLFVDSRANFQVAEQTCMGYNSTLLLIENQQENSAFQAVAARFSRGQSLYIGVYGNNQTVQGRQVSYSNYLDHPLGSGQDAIWGNGGCVAVTHWDQDKGHFWPGAWWPIDCKLARPFVCSRDPQSGGGAAGSAGDKKDQGPVPAIGISGFVAVVVIGALVCLASTAVLCMYSWRFTKDYDSPGKFAQGCTNLRALYTGKAGGKYPGEDRVEGDEQDEAKEKVLAGNPMSGQMSGQVGLKGAGGDLEQAAGGVQWRPSDENVRASFTSGGTTSWRLSSWMGWIGAKVKGRSSQRSIGFKQPSSAQYPGGGAEISPYPSPRSPATGLASVATDENGHRVSNTSNTSHVALLSTKPPQVPNTPPKAHTPGKETASSPPAGGAAGAGKEAGGALTYQNPLTQQQPLSNGSNIQNSLTSSAADSITVQDLVVGAQGRRAEEGGEHLTSSIEGETYRTHFNVLAYLSENGELDNSTPRNAVERMLGGSRVPIKDGVPEEREGVREGEGSRRESDGSRRRESERTIGADSRRQSNVANKVDWEVVHQELKQALGSWTADASEGSKRASGSDLGEEAIERYFLAEERDKPNAAPSPNRPPAEEMTPSSTVTDFPTSVLSSRSYNWRYMVDSIPTTNTIPRVQPNPPSNQPLQSSSTSLSSLLNPSQAPTSGPTTTATSLDTSILSSPRAASTSTGSVTGTVGTSTFGTITFSSRAPSGTLDQSLPTGSTTFTSRHGQDTTSSNTHDLTKALRLMRQMPPEQLGQVRAMGSSGSVIPDSRSEHQAPSRQQQQQGSGTGSAAGAGGSSGVEGGAGGGGGASGGSSRWEGSSQSSHQTPLTDSADDIASNTHRSSCPTSLNNTNSQMSSQAQGSLLGRPSSAVSSAISTHLPSLPSPGLHIPSAADVIILYDQKLGQGACGAVYRGVYRNLPVAVKVMDVENLSSNRAPRDQARIMASYRQEIAVMSRVQHPNILRMYGACVDPPNFLVVEELMDMSLAQHIHTKKRGLVTVREALNISLAIAKGLSHIHPTIVHRDLKPQNVLMSETGQVKIADFGASRIKIDTYLTESAHMAGTVPYMAPECLRCDTKVTEKCDIYSLGVILWEMVTGMKPWTGERAVGIIYRVALQGHQLEVPHGCPVPLANLIHQCFEVVPSRRPTAKQLVDMLAKVLKQLSPDELDDTVQSLALSNSVMNSGGSLMISSVSSQSLTHHTAASIGGFGGLRPMAPVTHAGAALHEMGMGGLGAAMAGAYSHGGSAGGHGGVHGGVHPGLGGIQMRHRSSMGAIPGSSSRPIGMPNGPVPDPRMPGLDPSRPSPFSIRAQPGDLDIPSVPHHPSPSQAPTMRKLSSSTSHLPSESALSSSSTRLGAPLTTTTNPLHSLHPPTSPSSPGPPSPYTINPLHVPSRPSLSESPTSSQISGKRQSGPIPHTSPLLRDIGSSQSSSPFSSGKNVVDKAAGSCDEATSTSETFNVQAVAARA